MPGFTEEKETMLNDGNLEVRLLLLQAAIFLGLEKVIHTFSKYAFVGWEREDEGAAVPFPEM